ncbi:MAG: GspH/FimT family pseudopilin [Candidatus Polarisedimenticolaceae bacterium]|nr:GspH/FimT family pseudopilin [Candidatus Polarisedimenticolaceae bacterium]
MNQMRAFTLVELIVTLAIGAILLSTGVPMFGTMLESNRASVRSIELRKALITTQSEATNKGSRVALCPINSSNDGCDTNSPRNWANGWLMFVDDGAIQGTYDAGEQILHLFQSTEGPHTVVVAADFIRYDPQGELASGVPTVFTIKYPQCTNRQARRVSISAIGRVSIETADC